MIYPQLQQSQERGLWTPNSVFTASPQKKKPKTKKRGTQIQVHTRTNQAREGLLSRLSPPYLVPEQEGFKINHLF